MIFPSFVPFKSRLHTRGRFRALVCALSPLFLLQHFPFGLLPFALPDYQRIGRCSWTVSFGRPVNVFPGSLTPEDGPPHCTMCVYVCVPACPSPPPSGVRDRRNRGVIPVQAIVDWNLDLTISNRSCAGDLADCGAKIYDVLWLC